jgi:hypothetical protein
VFEIIWEHMLLDPVKLRGGMEALKRSAERDHEKVARSLTTVARKIQAAEERKRQLIGLYASGHLPEAAYVDANVSPDKELHALKLKKAEFIHGLPLLHTAQGKRRAEHPAVLRDCPGTLRAMHDF